MWLLITTLAYFLMNGAQLFETFVIVPKWTASLPDSFQLFWGPYGLAFKRFWIITHSLHEIPFIPAIVFCWHLSDIRFQQLANTDGDAPNLAQCAATWKNLNYLRVALFVGLSLGLISPCLTLLPR